MPELPEVETIVRRFRPLLEGRQIFRFSSRWAKQATPSVGGIRRAIVGRTIERLGRRGKYIVFELAPPGFLLVHLRMSGRFEWAADHDREPPHVRTVWGLDDGQRFFLCDARKFGRVIYTDDLAAVTAELGLEPLARGFTRPALRKLLRGRARQIKPLLLDQSVVAGLGNIYTDECLHRAGVHPATRASALDERHVDALHAAIRSVLREGLRYRGTTFDWAYRGGGMQKRLQVYGRTGQPCRRCGTPIEYFRLGQRGTHICPQCQPQSKQA